MALYTVSDGRPRLAQELLDVILDHLHYDPKTLKQCALASRSLLPTCQCHLFSSFEISKSNARKLVKLFTPPDDGQDDEGAPLRAGVADLLNTYTTDLTLATYSDHEFNAAFESPHLPGFKNVQGIVFKGEALRSWVRIPSFLEGTWTSPNSGIRSAGFNFELMSGEATLLSLYTLPATVENVSVTCANSDGYNDLSAISIHRAIKNRHWNTPADQVVRHFGGTLRLHLAPYVSHERLLSAMLELKDLFKFNPKRIKYRLTKRSDIPPFASLLNDCKATLQSLDLACMDLDTYYWNPNLQLFNFSRHRALRRIRIWASAENFGSDWLSAAISSIPKPSSASPRVPPLRIELHISLPPSWMVDREARYDATREINEIVASWVPVDAELSQLIGLSPDLPSATSAPGCTTAGITLDVSVPHLTFGHGAGIAALMFPVLSGTKGVLRLV